MEAQIKSIKLHEPKEGVFCEITDLESGAGSGHRLFIFLLGNVINNIVLNLAFKFKLQDEDHLFLSMQLKSPQTSIFLKVQLQLEHRPINLRQKLLNQFG